MKVKEMFLKDKGFWIAVLATLIIMSLTVWSFNEKSRKTSREAVERRAKYEESFDSLESSSRKLDIALREAEESLKLLNDIKKDIDEIQAILQIKEATSEEEASKR